MLLDYSFIRQVQPLHFASRVRDACEWDFVNVFLYSKSVSERMGQARGQTKGAMLVVRRSAII